MTPIGPCSSGGAQPAQRRLARAVAQTLGVAATLCMAAPSYAACTIAGERVQWIADYCMATLSTDDEIAAGDCTARELGRSKPLADCAAVTHYKRALCTLAVQRGRPGSVASCVADRTFVGTTVRSGGVGR